MTEIASVVIRTLNEESYLPELLTSIRNQSVDGFDIEVVLVDSGSTDRTLEIAQSFGCRITHIKKEDFTFGRSLNVGCDFSNGDYLIFVSGHCIPATENWLQNLIRPLRDGLAEYSYGRQVARDTTKFSENELFNKFYPEYSKQPQEGYFCNNANAAVIRSAWSKFKFNEELTGLEDMYLARRIVEESEGHVAYKADAPVFHIHDESWRQVRIRYEREAYALQKIMPGMHFNLADLFRFYFAGVLQDMASAINKGVLIKELPSIILFRLMQYWGTYRGHHEHRKASQEMKYRYFYPKDIEREEYEKESSRIVTNEGK
ncbi:glycosyltransferase [Zhongshania sp. BJYM1]|uniref:glycosyltransferase n=1 Tax=Zhongshania aquatica TaxID=2965069 RepID=UPI0022B5D6D6|nr:glycosyltransferase [Marortus sp. BJYM1]